MRRRRSLYQGRQIKTLLENKTFYMFCQLPDQNTNTIDLLKASAEKSGLGLRAMKNTIVSQALQGTKIKGISNLLQGSVYLIYPLEENVHELSQEMFHFLRVIQKQKTANFLGLKWGEDLYTAEKFHENLLDFSLGGPTILKKQQILLQLIQSTYTNLPQNLTSPSLLLSRVLDSSSKKS